MNFDQIIIHSSSPTFCNIKPGNMFFVKNETFSPSHLGEWKTAFSKYGIMTFSTQLSETSTAILVLNVCWIRKILSDIFIQSYLTEKGYHTTSVFDFVDELLVRMKHNKGFPHEVGVILGYPIEDVIEFENHEGKDCKYCGNWKTYSDVENAKNCQCKYKDCRLLCNQLYEQGYSLNQIIEEYKRVSHAA